ncbi:MAG: rhodanese-like domain-containing protein [Solirubrobacteraceae bacterium]|jgi:rhodanese-related sulfurtransferase
MGWLKTALNGGQGIDARAADALVRAGATLVDVRSPAEWRAGHAPAAQHVPLGELDSRLDKLPRDRPVVAVCRAGGRSARATALPTRNGFDAKNLSGGMRAWASAGLDVKTDSGRKGTIV